ncbi:uncharacterized protein [Montipora capricornis]|uniref:uncharacterized protein isoform X2 n=1 Tax=Montipora capricornis TaxID=246305 RepID=UPI0035F11C26
MESDGDKTNAVGCPSETSLAGKASVCQGCPGQYLCSQQGGVDPDQEMIDLRMNAIQHKILILSGKGGWPGRPGHLWSQYTQVNGN